MCGRYTLSSPPADVAALFDLEEQPDLVQRYNVAPTQEAAVVRIAAPGAPRTLEPLRWGLVPYWAKEVSIGNRMINARSEGVAEKPAFRWSFRKARCLVPADGFYEWKKEGKVKQPYLLRRRDRKPFAIAGLWSRWRDPENRAAEPLLTFTLLTTTPNDLMRPLHDRMPVLLAREDFDLWLDPKVEDPARLEALLVPAPSEGWEAVPVSRAVNSPAYDGPGCIEPLVTEG